MKRRMWNDKHNPSVLKALKLMEAEEEVDAILGEDIDLKQTHFNM
jgi:hypothetical protein